MESKLASYLCSFFIVQQQLAGNLNVVRLLLLITLNTCYQAKLYTTGG